MSKSKTIVIDLRALQIGHESRGVGMVIINALENLKDDNNHYLLYMFDSSNPIGDLGINLNQLNYTIVTTPYLKINIKKISDIPNVLKLIFHRFNELKPFKPDYFVQFDFNLGAPRFRKIKLISIAHDLIPLIMPNIYLPSPSLAASRGHGKKQKLKYFLRAIYYQQRAKRSYKLFKRSDKVLAISNSTRDSLIDILKVNPEKIEVSYEAPAVRSDSADTTIKSDYHFQNPYIFYLGGTDSRKSIEDIIYALNLVNGRGRKLDLVLVGNELKSLKMIPNHTIRQAITNSPYRDQIHLLGYLSEQDKKFIYQNAHAFILASRYEGFGLPILEANLLGCPVVAYKNSAIAEIGKNSALLVKTGSYQEIAEAINQLFDQDRREAMIQAGYQEVTQYSWSNFTQQLKDSFN
ncbi:glycosyltransferase family 4 protein [Candidatus Nomurabacteria bacterium]|nr:glycosyltransferase family 4 protein [Candidatus Nomurabacteria bacterium]